MNPRILDIVGRLRTRFLNELPSSNEISLFLCGGSGASEAEFRKELGQQISQMRSKYTYSVYYPEDMFIELILGHQRQDLLSLENLLADSVHCVVILLQSPGTFTELGAFTNYDKLKDKLVVVIDPRHRRSRSFIALGPIRYLQDRTKSKVIYSLMDRSNLETLTKQVAEATRDIAKNSHPVSDLSNPILSYKFLLALVYVFDPIQKNFVFDVLKALGVNEEDVTVTAETVINSLVNERKLSLVSGRLSTTPKGADSLIYDSKTKKRRHDNLSFLTDLRLKALNLTLRKKYSRALAGR